MTHAAWQNLSGVPSGDGLPYRLPPPFNRRCRGLNLGPTLRQSPPIRFSTPFRPAATRLPLEDLPGALCLPSPADLRRFPAAAQPPGSLRHATPNVGARRSKRARMRAAFTTAPPPAAAILWGPALLPALPPPRRAALP